MTPAQWGLVLTCAAVLIVGLLILLSIRAARREYREQAERELRRMKYKAEAQHLAKNKDAGLTLEQKLEALASCGLRLKDQFSVDTLLQSYDREDWEEPGYSLTLTGLGMEAETAPGGYHAANVWHFDTECIEDHGDYARIAERMVEMAGGSLPLENIRDHVDIYDEGVAWLEFRYQGESVHIDCKVEDDWVDTSLFGHFVEMLKTSAPTKIYFYFDLGGQDCIIGCLTRDHYRKLKTLIPQVEPLT